MSPARAEALVKLNMRGLAVSFAVVGILFIATPDGVLHRIDQLGDALGSFSHAPRTEEKLWLALAFAYMTVITGLAFVVSLDPVRYRPMLLVLAAGKAASSLAAGAFYLEHDVFIYLLNFLVDGGLVLVVLGCWSLTDRIQARAPA
jgi:membrane-associated phospholipid phosphatase